MELLKHKPVVPLMHAAVCVVCCCCCCCYSTVLAPWWSRLSLTAGIFNRDVIFPDKSGHFDLKMWPTWIMQICKMGGGEVDMKWSSTRPHLLPCCVCIPLSFTGCQLTRRSPFRMGYFRYVKIIPCDMSNTYVLRCRSTLTLLWIDQSDDHLLIDFHLSQGLMACHVACCFTVFITLAKLL